MISLRNKNTPFYLELCSNDVPCSTTTSHIRLGVEYDAGVIFTMCISMKTYIARGWLGNIQCQVSFGQ